MICLICEKKINNYNGIIVLGKDRFFHIDCYIKTRDKKVIQLIELMKYLK